MMNTKVRGINLVEDMNVRTKFHGIPLSSCPDTLNQKYQPHGSTKGKVDHQSNYKTSSANHTFL